MAATMVLKLMAGKCKDCGGESRDQAEDNGTHLDETKLS